MTGLPTANPKPKKSKRRDPEPTPAEKEAARTIAYGRAQGMCQLRQSPDCWGYAPLNGPDSLSRGHLCHLKAKRRYGWRESAEQRHLWGCPPCHQASHNAGGRPCARRAEQA